MSSSLKLMIRLLVISGDYSGLSFDLSFKRKIVENLKFGICQNYCFDFSVLCYEMKIEMKSL